jgi:hypothetical protein
MEARRFEYEFQIDKKLLKITKFILLYMRIVKQS